MKRWVQWAQHLGGGLFLALFLTFLVQIGARFGLNRPLPWTDELAVVLYLWVILWASAFMVRTTELSSLAPSILRRSVSRLSLMAARRRRAPV